MIGNGVTVGCNAVIHACEVRDGCIVEDDAVILDGCVIEPGAVIERGSVVYPRTTLAGGHVYAGRPATAQVCLEHADGQREVRSATGEVPVGRTLRSATVQMPAGEAGELKVWVHRITPEWRSEALPGRLGVQCGDEAKVFDLAKCGGQAVLPIAGEACDLEITLAEASLM